MKLVILNNEFYVKCGPHLYKQVLFSEVSVMLNEEKLTEILIDEDNGNILNKSDNTSYIG